jgi:hypothetical protein
MCTSARIVVCPRHACAVCCASEDSVHYVMHEPTFYTLDASWDRSWQILESNLTMPKSRDPVVAGASSCKKVASDVGRRASKRSSFSLLDATPFFLIACCNTLRQCARPEGHHTSSFLIELRDRYRMLRSWGRSTM